MQSQQARLLAVMAAVMVIMMLQAPMRGCMWLFACIVATEAKVWFTEQKHTAFI